VLHAQEVSQLGKRGMRALVRSHLQGAAAMDAMRSPALPWQAAAGERRLELRHALACVQQIASPGNSAKLAQKPRRPAAKSEAQTSDTALGRPAASREAQQVRVACALALQDRQPGQLVRAEFRSQPRRLNHDWNCVLAWLLDKRAISCEAAFLLIWMSAAHDTDITMKLADFGFLRRAWRPQQSRRLGKVVGRGGSTTSCKCQWKRRSVQASAAHVVLRPGVRARMSSSLVQPVVGAFADRTD
jgi:hypothetical protein